VTTLFVKKTQINRLILKAKIATISKYRYIDHSFGIITDMKGISQEFPDCGIHKDKSTIIQHVENCGLRA
jgi:predicted metallo-beta-lactamase superfamily hydrolase